MSTRPQDGFNEKGFWDGGATGHGTNRESSGRRDGFPGSRTRSGVGVKTDIEQFLTVPPDEAPGVS